MHEYTRTHLLAVTRNFLCTKGCENGISMETNEYRFHLLNFSHAQHANLFSRCFAPWGWIWNFKSSIYYLIKLKCDSHKINVKIIAFEKYTTIFTYFSFIFLCANLHWLKQNDQKNGHKTNSIFYYLVRCLTSGVWLDTTMHQDIFLNFTWNYGWKVHEISSPIHWCSTLLIEEVKKKLDPLRVQTTQFQYVPPYDQVLFRWMIFQFNHLFVTSSKLIKIESVKVYIWHAVRHEAWTP